MATFAEALEVKLRVERSLLALPGVHTVGLGGKVSNGSPTGEVAIRVQVTKKRSLEDLPLEERIPEIIDGIKTDVIQAGRWVPYGALDGGIEVSWENDSLAGVATIGNGTLGCFARTVETIPKAVLLSNDHVLYGKTPGPRQNDGDPIMVGSSSGCAHKIIANLLRTSGPNDTQIDAAIATLVSGVDWQARIHGVAVTGILDVSPENFHLLPPTVQTNILNHTYLVNKFGSTTALSRGKIVDNAATSLPQGQLPGRVNQLEIKSISGDYFSQPGDSGSAIYDDNGAIVGLLWAGDPGDLPKTDPLYTPPPYSTLACHIAYVQSKLAISIATNEPSVVYRVGGEPQLHPAFVRIYTDLSASGRQKEFVKLYGRHSEEIRELLKKSRAFVVAWHRNHGPKIVRSLLDLVGNVRSTLPTDFDGRSWADCFLHIEDALIEIGSHELLTDIRRYKSIAVRLGGRSYQEVLGFLLTSEIEPADSSSPKAQNP